MRLPRSLAPLGHRNYALYLAGFATARIGRSIEEVGAVWLMSELTDSLVLFGFLGLARAVPGLVVSPLAGVVADRFDQRRLLFVAQALALVASLILGILAVTGWVEFWHLYVQVAFQASVRALDASVRDALFPRLVSRAVLPEAVTLSSTAGRTSAFVGPAIGGVAIALIGVGSPFFINAVTFVPLMAALALMRGVTSPTRNAGSTLRGDFMEGLRHILDAPVLSGLLKLELVFGIFQVNPVIVTIIGKETLNVGPEGLGGLLSVQALGALLGVVVLLVMGQTRRQGRFVILCQLGYAASLVGFALSPDYSLSLLAIAMTGLLDSVVTVTRHSVMQLSAPGRMRGRVMANMGTITRTTSPLAELQSGVMASALGGPLAVMTAAGAVAIAAGATARLNPALWRFSRHQAIQETIEEI